MLGAGRRQVNGRRRRRHSLALDQVIERGVEEDHSARVSDLAVSLIGGPRRLTMSARSLPSTYCISIGCGGCTSAEIDREQRKGQKPSDHAPVMAVFD